MRNYNLRKKILALTLTAITMFSTIAGFLPGSIAQAACNPGTSVSSGTYYGIDWTMDAEGNLSLKEGTCTDVQGDKWSNTAAKTVKCDGDILCNNYFCESLFYENTNLVSADLSGFNTNNVTNIASMFYGCENLTSLDVSSFNTSNVTTMESMFYKCKALTSLNLSNFDTRNVINMEGMFDSCSSLTSLDLSNFNTSKVTEIYYMFSECSSLTSLNLSNFDTSNVTSLEGMFYDCNSLTSLNISNFNTSKVTNMAYMFTNCRNIKELDLSSFNTNKVNSASDMLAGCDGLEVLTTPKIVGAAKIDLPFTMYDKAKISYNKLFSNTVLYSHMDTGTGNYYGIDWTLDAEGNLILHAGTATDHITSAPTKWDNTIVKTVTTDGPIIIKSNNFCPALFQNCAAESIDLSEFDTSSVTSMPAMFQNCSNLKSLNISSFDTSKVTQMPYMFAYCSSLESLDLSNFDTSNVTVMPFLFTGCTKLKNLDLSSFEINTSVTPNMFSGIIDLECLKTPKSVTSSISFAPITMCDDNGTQYTELNSENTNKTLTLCINDVCYGIPYTYYKSTETIVLHEGVATDVPGDFFSDTTKIVKTDGHIVANNAFCCFGPFSHIPNAEIIDLANVDTSNVTNMNGMFYDCKKLRSLNISNFDTSNVTQMYDMFEGCSSLESLDLSNFNTSNVTNMQYMFRDCSALKSLDLSNFDMKKVTWPAYIYGMFYGLDSLQVLKTPKAMDHNPELIQNAQFDYLMHDIVNDVYYENLSVENTTLYNEANCSKTTTTDSIEASYDENNNLVVKASQTITYPLGAKVTKTIDVDTYGVKDQGATLLITYDGASTEIEKIVNIEGTLLYDDGTPAQKKVVKLSIPEDKFDLSSDEGRYEFTNVPVTNNIMPVSVFDTDNTSACNNDTLLTTGAVTFDNTGSPVLDNDPSKEMTLIIEKVIPTVPEREEVVVPAPEIVPTPKPSATTTIVVPGPVVDNATIADNTNIENTPAIETSAPAEKIAINALEENTKPEIKNAANKNDTISENSEQNNKKLTDFSKNSEKDNSAVKDNTEDKIEQSSLSESKDTKSINNILIIIACILIILFFAWLIHSLHKNTRL